MFPKAITVYVLHVLFTLTSVLVLDGGEMKRLSDGCDEEGYCYLIKLTFSASLQLLLISKQGDNLPRFIVETVGSVFATRFCL